MEQVPEDAPENGQSVIEAPEIPTPIPPEKTAEKTEKRKPPRVCRLLFKALGVAAVFLGVAALALWGKSSAPTPSIQQANEVLAKLDSRSELVILGIDEAEPFVQH